MMDREFLLYEEAVSLKLLGFNEPCMSYFDARGEHQIGNFDFTEVNGYNESPAALSPLYQQAFRWFRENCKLRSFIDTYAQDKENNFVSFYTIKSGDGFNKEPFFSGTFKSYEKAELACLKKLIEMSKEGYSMYEKHDTSITITKKK